MAYALKTGGSAVLKKVIVVDDEQILRQGLVMMTPWQEADCVVVGEAKDAEEALRLMEKVQPDIAVVDIKMPGMNGLELIETAEARAVCSKKPLYIILSGYGEFSYAQQAIELGVSSYLLKPVSDDELMDAVRKASAAVDARRSVEKLTAAQGSNESALFTHFGMGKIQNQYLAQAVRLMEERCKENLTIKEVADEIGISASYLHRLFRERAEYSFGEYLTLCRMRRAAKDLGEGRLRIYEIAEHCGYRNTRYFSSVFRRVMGMTPTEYREGVAAIGSEERRDSSS